MKRKFLNEKIVVYIILSVLPILYYWGYIVNHMLLVSGDGASYFSFRNFFNLQIWTDGFPLWNKYLELGLPYGMYDTVGLYPVALIFSFLPANVFSYVYYFFHIIVGACFFYNFLLEIKCNRSSALVTAIIYELSTHIGGLRKSHIMLIVGIVYLPIILYFIQKYLNTKQFKWLIVSSVFMGVQFLGAHTQVVVYTDVAVFCYLVIQYIINRIRLKTVIGHLASWLLTYFCVIMAQLYTVFAFMKDVSELGNSTIPFDTFKSYSIHPIKLLQMLFPEIWGENINQALGLLFSSEIDIEIYLGVYVLCCIMFCVVFLRRNHIVKISITFMIIAFLYSAMAHVPLLSEFVYRLPVFGGFRVPSRALFIFIYFGYVMLAITISKLSEYDTMTKFAQFSLNYAYVILLMIGIVYIGFSCNITLSGSGNADYLSSLNNIFMKPALVCILIMLCSFTCKRIKNVKFQKRCYYILCGIILVCTVCETYVYSHSTQGVTDAYYDKSTSEDIVSEISASNYKVLDAYAGIDGAHASLIGENSAVNKGIMGINAYITYNNPRLYRILTGNSDVPLNYSGLMTGFLNMDEILRQKNDVLSVMGVRYIIDSSSLLMDNPLYIAGVSKEEIEIYSDNKVVSLDSSNYIYYDAAPFQANSVYKVSFDLQEEEKSELYFDIITADGFDGYNEQISFDPGTNHVEFTYVTDGQQDYANSYFRIVSAEKKEVTVSNLCICEAGNTIDWFIENNSALKEYSDLEFEVGYSVKQLDFEVEANSNYLICLDMDYTSLPQTVVIGLGEDGILNDNYQKEMLNANSSLDRFCVINTEGTENENADLNLAISTESGVVVRSVKIFKLNDETQNAYIPYYGTGEEAIYLNNNAKDVFFTLRNVETLGDNEYIYEDTKKYDLLNVAYIRDPSEVINVKDAEATVTGIDFSSSNKAVCTVLAKDKCFIAFSQSYNSGWKAYIDGKETKVYQTDDLIMGIFVPEGEHEIVFKFSMPLFWGALVFTFGVIVFWTIYFAAFKGLGKNK